MGHINVCLYSQPSAFVVVWATFVLGSFFWDFTEIFEGKRSYFKSTWGKSWSWKSCFPKAIFRSSKNGLLNYVSFFVYIWPISHRREIHQFLHKRPSNLRIFGNLNKIDFEKWLGDKIIERNSRTVCLKK